MTPLRYSTVMLTIDDSDFTPDHIEFLHEWADNLCISFEVLLARTLKASASRYVTEASSASIRCFISGGTGVFLFSL